MKKSLSAYSIEELAKEACKRNEYVKSYLLMENKNNNNNNSSFKIERNRKLRGVYNLLLENSHIFRIREKPIVLQWRDNKPLL